MKKILILLVLVFGLFLVGCNGATKDFINEGKDLPANILKANAQDDFIDLYDDIKSHTEKTFKNIAMVDSTSTIYVVKDDSGKTGVYNAVLDKMIIDYTENVTIVTIQTSLQAYIQVKNSDSKYSLYDPNGVLLVSDSSNSFYVNITRNYEEDELVDDTFTEYINHYDEDYNIKVIENTITYDYKRTENSEDDYKLGKKIKQEIDGDDLEEAGLKGYKIDSKNNTYYIYNKEDKLICSFENLSTRGYTVYGAFAGNVYYQKTIQLSEDAKKYDYTKVINDQTLKFDVITLKVDLKTGKVKEIECPFVFQSSVSIKDAKGKYNLGYCTVKLIEGKLLTKTDSYVLNENLKIKYNTDIDISNLYKLDKNHYYDATNKVIYDKQFKKVYEFNSEVSFSDVCPSSNIIVCVKDGKYGAIDFDAKLVIPFEYDDIIDICDSDKLIVRKSSKYKLYSLKNGVVSTDAEIKGTNGFFYYTIDSGNKSHYYLPSDINNEVFSTPSPMTFAVYELKDCEYCMYRYVDGSTNSYVIYTQLVK